MQHARTAALAASVFGIISLGCRSPFPRDSLAIDELQVGMRPDGIRELMGVAEQETAFTWIYEDEVTSPWLVAMAVPFAPMLILLIPVLAISDAVEGTETPPLWVEKRTTTLLFEDGRLARWDSEVEPYPAWQSDGSYTGWHQQPGFGTSFDWPKPPKPKRKSRPRPRCVNR